MSNSQKYLVTASSLNVRQDPSIHSPVIGYLKRGDLVEVFGSSDDNYWLNIRKDGLHGWASYKHLSLVVPDSGDEEFPWMPIALGEIGVKVYRDPGENPRIVEYLRSTSLSQGEAGSDETAWCSGFVNWCIEHAGFEGTDSAWARDWLNWGMVINQPRRGCIVVFSRNSKGHVGFYISETEDEIYVLGGNQSNQVKISVYPRSRLLGYRLPG